MSSKIECAGYTKSGTRCKRDAAVDSIYCWQHKEIVEEKKEIVRPISPKKLSPKCISSIQTCPIIPKESKSFLTTGEIPVNAILTGEPFENSYLSDSKSNIIYGFGPFTIKVPVGDHDPILQNIKFVEDRDYTLKEIIDRIIQFYQRDITIELLEKLIENDPYEDEDELYGKLLEKKKKEK